MELDAGCDIGTSYCKRTVAALCADSSNGSSGSTPDEPTFVLPKLDDDLPSGGTSALSRCCFDWESAMSSVRVWRSLLRPLLCRVSAEEVGCRLDDQSECSSNTCIPWHNTRTITKKNTDLCCMPQIVVPACALAFGRDAAERTDALCELLFIVTLRSLLLRQIHSHASQWKRLCLDILSMKRSVVHARLYLR